MRALNQSLTAGRLCELLSYDDCTGLFNWRKRNRRVAGSDDGRGYIKIRIDGVKYPSHRLAWLYVTGSWPTKDLDHIDGNPSNNAFANLREVSHSENLWNRGANKTQNGRAPTSPFKGVTWCSWACRWRAQIMHNGVKHDLGRHDTEEAAAAVYREKEQELRGEFSRGAA